MKTVVAALHSPTGEGRKPRVAGTNVEWLAMKPAQDPDAARHYIQVDFTTSIWCGAMVGCIGATVISPFPEIVKESRRKGERGRKNDSEATIGLVVFNISV